jgi:purine catabolism regulator
MVNVCIPVYDVLRLEPFAGARCEHIQKVAEVHAVDARGERSVLRDATGEPVAEIAAHSAEVPEQSETPLITLAPGISPLSAATAVAAELQAGVRTLAERSNAILQALTQAELHGSSLREIVTLLERLVGNPVILKDASHRVLAWSGQPANIDPARRVTLEHGIVTGEILQALTKHGVLDRIRNERAAFRIEGDEEVGLGPRVMCPVRAADTLLGYLSISEGLRELDALDLLAVESGAMVVAFHMSRERAVEESVRSQRTLLLYELLYSPENTGERRIPQASLLGFDIDRDFTVLAIRFDDSPMKEREPDRWRRQLNAVVSLAESTSERLGVKTHLSVAEDDGVLLIVPSMERDLDVLVAALLDDIEAHERVPSMAVGLSPPRPAALGLGRSYDAARIAARLGRTVKGPRSITHYADLGVLRLLNEMSEDVVADHVVTTLTDDKAFQEQFVETFGAYANAGYNKAAAARRLFIHVNTMKYRLSRIHAVTGHDPTEHHGRFALECTLRLLELRRARDKQSEATGGAESC